MSIHKSVDHRRDLWWILGFFVPTGYPNSVSSDYLAYQLWTLPTHVTGWVSVSLATGSLLKAVGVGTNPVSATAVAAAIKWIAKDGVGALGRLFVGGPLGAYIDEDPRLWRIIAEAVSTIGLSLEIATVFFPSRFLLLAGTGNFAKALAKGMAKPAFRVIQQHFARDNNIGEVSAKEESWEVAGQMMGLLMSVGILTTLQDASDWQPILATWIGFQSFHVVCRILALDVLQFDFLNLVRARRLIQYHLQHQKIPDAETISQEENFLIDWMKARPKIYFGISLKDIQIEEFSIWVQMFDGEDYLLWYEEGGGYVVLKEECSQLALLKALWQFLWLEQESKDASRLSLLEASLLAVNARFNDFCAQAAQSGWNLDNCVFRTASARVSTLT